VIIRRDERVIKACNLIAGKSNQKLATMSYIG